MFETQSIQEILELKFGVKGEYTLQELSSIDTLTIKRIDNDKSLMPVNFKELVMFKNLKKLYIKNCILDKEIFEILSFLSLKSLELYNCEPVEQIEDILFSLNIEKILIDNTKLKYSYIEEINIPHLILANIELPNIPINCHTLDIRDITLENKDLSNIYTNTIIIRELEYKKHKQEIDNISNEVILYDEDNLKVNGD